eukprot:UN06672
MSLFPINIIPTHSKSITNVQNQILLQNISYKTCKNNNNLFHFDYLPYLMCLVVIIFSFLNVDNVYGISILFI